MRARLPLAIALAGSIVVTGSALAAPAPITAPWISGTPSYQSRLSCVNGTWWRDAAAFDYAWYLAPDGPRIAIGRTWRVDAAHVGALVICIVTARDAKSATATAQSASVQPGAATPTLRVSAIVTGAHGVVRFSGTSNAAGWVTGYRELRGPALVRRLHQTNGHVRPNGTWSITATEPAGRHAYDIRFTPLIPRLFTTTTLYRTVVIRP